MPLITQMLGKLPSVKHLIVTTDEGHMPRSTPQASWLCYDTLVGCQPGFRAQCAARGSAWSMLLGSAC